MDLWGPEKVDSFSRFAAEKFSFQISRYEVISRKGSRFTRSTSRSSFLNAENAILLNVLWRVSVLTGTNAVQTLKYPRCAIRFRLGGLLDLSFEERRLGSGGW